jgi:hypothetical protein
MTHTALATAFQKAGLHPRDAALDVAMSKAVETFIRAGGTADRAADLLRRAADILSGGGSLDKLARNAGHCSNAVPAGERGGHRAAAHHTIGAAPAREPSADQRRAAAAVRNVVAITVLDTFKIRDGRAIGDVRMGEVERLRAANAIEAAIFRQIQKHAVTGSDARIRDVIKPEEFQRMHQLAAEVADAQ